jgi:hypothetical protein
MIIFSRWPQITGRFFNKIVVPQKCTIDEDSYEFLENLAAVALAKLKATA